MYYNVRGYMVAYKYCMRTNSAYIGRSSSFFFRWGLQLYK